MKDKKAFSSSIPFAFEHLKKIWVLQQLVDAGSFKKAASMMQVTTSAVSQTITSLEAQLGIPLVIRSREEVRPTPAAIDILTKVRPAFEIFLNVSEPINEKTPQISYLRLGSYESIAIDLLPKFITRLNKILPKMQLTLFTSRTEVLLKMLKSGELCFALTAEFDEMERFQVAPLVEDRFGFFISPHASNSLNWELTKSLGVGTLHSPSTGHPFYLQKYLRQFSDLRNICQSDSMETLLEGAVQGIFVAILPTRVAARRASELIEITPPFTLKSQGKHGLFLVGMPRCDQQEFDFLKKELQLLFLSKAEFSNSPRSLELA